MKSLLLGFALCWGTYAYGQSTVWVEGYITSSGTYVPGHNRTVPNQTRNDNFSTRPNVNPYTGEVGTKPRDEDALDKLLRQQSVSTCPEPLKVSQRKVE